MCLIVDTNVAHRVILKEDDPDFSSLSHEINRGNARIVYGGKLREEYRQHELLRQRVLSLDRAGIARQVSSIDYQSELEKVEATHLCVSNDAHIIALARAAKVRLICTSDTDLMKDVKNRKLVREGKVYTGLNCFHLIRECCK
jgi:predicted nucleic acid-binding protein